MPKLSDDAKRKRRQHILQAARACMLRDGFHATTMTDICVEAGVSAGAVYVYFDGKHALVESLAEDTLTAMCDALARLDENGASPAAVLGLMLARLFSKEGGNDAKLDLHLWAEATRDARLRGHLQDAFGQVHAALQKWLQQVELLPGWTPAAAAHAIEAMMLGFEVLRSVDVDVDVDVLSQGVLQLFPSQKDA